MGNMNMIAVGGYLAGLRSARDWNTAEVAAKLKPMLRRDVDATSIWRAERNKMTPGGDMLIALCVVLGANWADVVYVSGSQLDADEAMKLGLRAGGADAESEALIEAWRRVPAEKRAALLDKLQEETGEG